MIIPIELKFTADKDSKSAFRTDKTIKSHDVNSVEFHITIDGLELTDTHTAKILSVFHSSKSQKNVGCEIVEGKIIYKPDTNLISRHEHVTNYVYVYNNNQSLDVREFIYTVDPSKIDETSLEVKDVYDQSYADLLADFEQALSDYKDSLPQADSVRADIDEVLNQFSEDSQAKLNQYDNDAQQAIADNQTAFDVAEDNRQDAYEQAESERNQLSAQSVIDWTQDADVLLETVEGNESARVDAETTRKTAETERIQAEQARKEAETERELAENERENAEEQRKTDHANRSAELDGKADKVVIKNLVENGDFSDGTSGWSVLKPALSSEEYHSSPNSYYKPTSSVALYRDIALPNDHIIYLSVFVKSTNRVDLRMSKFNTWTSIGMARIDSSDEWTLLSLTGRSINGGIRIDTGVSDGENYFDDFIVINLTEAFGAGNEPTKEEMDELIKVTGYIDGEYALNNKELLNWTLALIRRNTSAIIALGGA